MVSLQQTHRTIYVAQVQCLGLVVNTPLQQQSAVYPRDTEQAAKVVVVLLMREPQVLLES
jgi:hypothetical protein